MSQTKCCMVGCIGRTMLAIVRGAPKWIKMDTSHFRNEGMLEMPFFLQS
jgi:hypothetical protein